jgi:GAF domain-containing protein
MSDNDLHQEVEGSTGRTEDTKRQLLIRLIGGQTLALVFLAAMVAAGGLILSDNDLFMLIPIAGAAVLIGAVSYWLVRRGKFNLAGYLFLLGTTAAITAVVSIRGYRDASALYYLWPILGAVSVLETRGSFFIVAISAALYGTLVASEALGLHIPPLPYNPAEESLMSVGSRILMFFLLSYLVRLSAKDVDRALRAARNAARRWRDLNETLERRVSERTADLERRSTQLEATAQIAQDAAAMPDPHELLQHAVSIISDKFGLYHAGIYLLGPNGDWAVLQAASSAGGQRMLEYGHRLRVGTWSIIGRVTSEGRSHVIPDTTIDAAYAPPIDLPETQSRVVLPLQARGSIIGALDVHSVEPNAFSDEDVVILQTMADQIAVAISSARIFQRLQESLEALQSAYGEASLEEWAKLTRDTAVGYRYDRRGTALIPEDKDTETEGDFGLPVVSVPIQHRDYTIGFIKAHKHADGSKWTEQEVNLLETLADQLSTTLESARLYQDTQHRATREQLTRQITGDIRAADDIDEAVKKAISSLSRALNVSSMVVRIGTRDTLLSREEGEMYDA